MPSESPQASGPSYRKLETAEEVDAIITDEMLNEAIDWFDDERNMPVGDFLDRLFPRYGSILDEAGNEVDLSEMDNLAARRIMTRARQLRKEREL